MQDSHCLHPLPRVKRGCRLQLVSPTPSPTHLNTVYREIYALLNFCEFREFWQIVKFSFAKFHNVGVACRARGNSQIFFRKIFVNCHFAKNLQRVNFPIYGNTDDDGPAVVGNHNSQVHTPTTQSTLEGCTSTSDITDQVF